MKKNTANTTIRNQNLFCLNCGEQHVLVYPICIQDMNKKIEAFNMLHGYCEQTWKEPEPPKADDAYEKAMFWLNNGEKGMSSETIWNCLMGNKDFSISYPHDGGDFGRCYKLLEIVPEWKTELKKLKSLSKEWSILVDHWEELTSKYEKNVSENWRNSDEIGLSRLIQKLTKNF